MYGKYLVFPGEITFLNILKVKLSNGVKRGEALSPILFTIHIDKLLLELKGSGYGCHITNKCVG